MYAACNKSTTYDTFKLLIDAGMSLKAQNHAGENILMFYLNEKVICCALNKNASGLPYHNK